MSWDDDDFNSPDPFVRFNAHQAAKGRSPMPDSDVIRKASRENPTTSERIRAAARYERAVREAAEDDARARARDAEGN